MNQFWGFRFFRSVTHIGQYVCQFPPCLEVPWNSDTLVSMANASIIIGWNFFFGGGRKLICMCGYNVIHIQICSNYINILCDKKLLSRWNSQWLELIGQFNPMGNSLQKEFIQASTGMFNGTILHVYLL